MYCNVRHQGRVPVANWKATPGSNMKKQNNQVSKSSLMGTIMLKNIGGRGLIFQFLLSTEALRSLAITARMLIKSRLDKTGPGEHLFLLQ